MFTEKFAAFVCEGDSITCDVDGFTLTATVYNDSDSGPPWKDCDGHGPVSEWVRRDKLPGERVVSSDGNARRFYDFAEAVRIATRDRWGLPKGATGTTPGEIAAAAAESDFRYIKAWCDDVWHYVGIAVVVSRAGVKLTGKYSNALWGIEANLPDDGNAYLTEVANEYVEQALTMARAKLAQLCGA